MEPRLKLLNIVALGGAYDGRRPRRTQSTRSSV